MCPKCHGAQVRFLAYHGDLSHALMTCACGWSFVARLEDPQVPADFRVERVLVVEPHTDTRELFNDALTLEGVNVQVAATARAAMYKVSEWECRPGFLITELRLPDEDGFELIRQLKQLCPATPLRIVVVTAEIRPEKLIEAQRVADSVLVKPCTPWTVLAEIRRVAAHHPPTLSPNSPSPQAGGGPTRS